MSAPPRPTAAMRHKLHSYLLQRVVPPEHAQAPAPPKHLMLEPSDPSPRRGWRPASGKRESVGGGVRTAAGCLRTEATNPSPLALELRARRPASAVTRRAAVVVPLPTEAPAAGDATTRADTQLVAIAAAARARVEGVIWNTSVPREHPAASRARSLCAMASDEYERELLRALRTSAASLSAATLRVASARAATAASALDEGGAPPPPSTQSTQPTHSKAEPLRAEFQRHMTPSLTAWRRVLEQSGALLHAALAAQALTEDAILHHHAHPPTIVDGLASSSGGAAGGGTVVDAYACLAPGMGCAASAHHGAEGAQHGVAPQPPRPNSPVGVVTQADLASLRALLSNEMAWVVGRSHAPVRRPRRASNARLHACASMQAPQCMRLERPPAACAPI